MAIQIVDIYLPRDQERPPIDKEDIVVLEQWEIPLEGNQKLLRVLLESEQTEALLDAIHDIVEQSDAGRIVVTNVEAVLPRPDEKDQVQVDEEKRFGKGRISREELYQDVNDALKTNSVHYILVVLSTVVAAIGMIRDNVAVVIGAMVIAPLIGPNMAFALGTTLGDTDLLYRAAKTNLAGIALAFALSVAAGLFVDFDPSVAEIASRSEVNLADLGLALAAGVAGALSLTRGVSSALIGVMVAVALLPPLVALGLYVGDGMWDEGIRAGLLLFTNVAAINLAGVLTFVIQGIRPKTWYESERAQTATRIALVLWLLLLGILVFAIHLAGSVER